MAPGGAVRVERRVRVPVAVHLGHQPDVDGLPGLGDVPRHPGHVAVVLAAGDLARGDDLGALARLRREREHTARVGRAPAIERARWSAARASERSPGAAPDGRRSGPRRRRIRRCRPCPRRRGRRARREAYRRRRSLAYSAPAIISASERPPPVPRAPRTVICVPLDCSNKLEATLVAIRRRVRCRVRDLCRTDISLPLFRTPAEEVVASAPRPPVSKATNTIEGFSMNQPPASAPRPPLVEVLRPHPRCAPGRLPGRRPAGDCDTQALIRRRPFGACGGIFADSHTASRIGGFDDGGSGWTLSGGAAVALRFNEISSYALGGLSARSKRMPPRSSRGQLPMLHRLRSPDDVPFFAKQSGRAALLALPAHARGRPLPARRRHPNRFRSASSLAGGKWRADVAAFRSS